MIGRCPNCGIELDKSPFTNRETNEVMIVMKYRKKLDSNEEIKSLEELGYCEICNATLKEIKEQNNSK